MTYIPFPVPCEDCGAEVGQPCIIGCPTQDDFDEDDYEDGGGPLGQNQREWEEHYRTHSSSVTGINEGP